MKFLSNPLKYRTFLSLLLFAGLVHGSQQILAAQELGRESFTYQVNSVGLGVQVDVSTLPDGQVSTQISLLNGAEKTRIATIDTNGADMHGRQMVFPAATSRSSVVSPGAHGSPVFRISGEQSEALAKGGFLNGYLLFSIPASATMDRLVMIDLVEASTSIGTPRGYRWDEIQVPTKPEYSARIYRVKGVRGSPAAGPNQVAISDGVTLLSIADVDAQGRISTFGTGIVFYRMFFATGREFTNFHRVLQSLRLKDRFSMDVVDAKTGELRFRPLNGPTALPTELPPLTLREGRVEPSILLRNRHMLPEIVETTTRQGTGILSLPYFPPAAPRNPRPVADLLAAFDPANLADLTIAQAEAASRLELSNAESVRQIRDAVLARSSVTAESRETRQALRLRQAAGLQILSSLAVNFPPALEALKSIAESSEADSTLKANASKSVRDVEKETTRSPRSLRAYNDLMNDVRNGTIGTSRCEASFISIR